jgi:hypothetical protein
MEGLVDGRWEAADRAGICAFPERMGESAMHEDQGGKPWRGDSHNTLYSTQISAGIASHEGDINPCSLYFLNVLVDTTIGELYDSARSGPQMEELNAAQHIPQACSSYTWH